MVKKFKVFYRIQRPGGDEFGCRGTTGSVIVEAENLEDSFKVAETKMGKYSDAYQSTEMP